MDYNKASLALGALMLVPFGIGCGDDDGGARQDAGRVLDRGLIPEEDMGPRVEDAEPPVVDAAPPPPDRGPPPGGTLPERLVVRAVPVAEGATSGTSSLPASGRGPSPACTTERGNLAARVKPSGVRSRQPSTIPSSGMR